MPIAVELICDIRGLSERQSFTTHVQSTETVEALRDRLPSELGLSPGTRLRLYNAQTGAEYATVSQTLQDAGITEVPAVYVREVRRKHRTREAKMGSGDPRLRAEIERLTKENETLREELRKLGKEVPPGKSLLSGDTQAMEEEEDDEEGAATAVAPVLPATATKRPRIAQAGESGTVSIGGGGGGFALDLGSGASSFAVSTSATAQVGMSEETAPAAAPFAINTGGANHSGGGVGTVSLEGGGGGGGGGVSSSGDGGVKIKF